MSHLKSHWNHESAVWFVTKKENQNKGSTHVALMGLELMSVVMVIGGGYDPHQILV